MYRCIKVDNNWQYVISIQIRPTINYWLKHDIKVYENRQPLSDVLTSVLMNRSSTNNKATSDLPNTLNGGYEKEILR